MFQKLQATHIQYISAEDAPATFKSLVWQHFGYLSGIINGYRVAEKMQTICKHCEKTLPYNNKCISKTTVKCSGHSNNEIHSSFHCS